MLRKIGKTRNLMLRKYLWNTFHWPCRGVWCCILSKNGRILRRSSVPCAKSLSVSSCTIMQNALYRLMGHTQSLSSAPSDPLRTELLTASILPGIQTVWGMPCGFVLTDPVVRNASNYWVIVCSGSEILPGLFVGRAARYFAIIWCTSHTSNFSEQK